MTSTPTVVGVDPARASIDVAHAEPGSERVRWICGDATGVPSLQVDLVTMTANVAQAVPGDGAHLPEARPTGRRPRVSREIDLVKS
ncbi:hypothetical protein ACWEJ6_11765 [Nonomuraea sp. NPDC004702]